MPGVYGNTASETSVPVHSACPTKNDAFYLSDPGLLFVMAFSAAHHTECDGYVAVTLRVTSRQEDRPADILNSLEPDSFG